VGEVHQNAFGDKVKVIEPFLHISTKNCLYFSITVGKWRQFFFWVILTKELTKLSVSAMLNTRIIIPVLFEKEGKYE
jgi:hypothetical protein